MTNIFKKNNYDYTNVLMRNIQLPNHFSRTFDVQGGSSEVVYQFICLIKWDCVLWF